MFKTILAPLNGDDSDQAVLDTALTVARRFNSHIHAYHDRIDSNAEAASLPQISYEISGALRGALETLTKRDTTRAKWAERSFAEFCALYGVATNGGIGYDGVSAELTQEQGHLIERLCRQARHHDLVVMARPVEADGAPDNLPQRVLLEGGAPLLLVPEYSSSRLLDTVMIFWKDSVEAAHAVTSALPLLQQAKQAILMMVKDKPGSDLNSAQAVQQRLAWHGVHAETREAPARGVSTMDNLMSCALSCHADLLVMGGFSRGPIRELLLGGCTQSAMMRGDVPVFIAR